MVGQVDRQPSFQKPDLRRGYERVVALVLFLGSAMNIARGSGKLAVEARPATASEALTDDERLHKQPRGIRLGIVKAEMRQTAAANKASAKLVAYSRPVDEMRRSGAVLMVYDRSCILRLVKNRCCKSRVFDRGSTDLPNCLACIDLRQIIHHEFHIKRRGRPFGPAPLGRGLATVQEFIRDLEKEAEEDAR